MHESAILSQCQSSAVLIRQVEFIMIIKRKSPLLAQATKQDNLRPNQSGGPAAYGHTHIAGAQREKNDMTLIQGTKTSNYIFHVFMFAPPPTQWWPEDHLVDYKKANTRLFSLAGGGVLHLSERALPDKSHPRLMALLFNKRNQQLRARAPAASTAILVLLPRRYIGPHMDSH